MVRPSEDAGRVTAALEALRQGETEAKDELLLLVYDDLKQLARTKLAGLGPGQTLQPTALVHEAWMRICKKDDSDWKSRQYFFGTAARAMRNILVEQARRKGTFKRGGHHKHHQQIDEAEPEVEQPVDNILALDESLHRLQQIEPRQAEVVMLRFFAGLSWSAVADVLEVSLGTVERDWRFARAWLQSRIEGFESS